MKRITSTFHFAKGWVSALLLVLLLAGSGTLTGRAATNQSIIFNRDIRPIFSDQCFHCHGFDANKRKADLRLDTAEGIAAVIKGRPVVKPGDPNASELVSRVSSKDPAVMMPPPDSGKKLKPEEIEKLRQWIQEGAVYQKHWAFEPARRPETPAVAPKNQARNDIDLFIVARLQELQLQPSPEAPRETLIRRVTLDLTGLPPTVQEVDAFLGDTAPDAYERLVDRLLESPRYGEHMAKYWLDAARYGDTHGLHLDNERSMWAYRDWVVQAFNANLPFDQFTIWQLAGDLLPKPTREQLIASGFNRCNVSTSEGGAIDEEFHVRYAVDRVETTSTVWMGLTMGCAVCHDHKLDPITQKEFYQVFSIFNNMAEKAMDGNALLPPPIKPLPTPEQEQKLGDLAAQMADLETRIQTILAKIDYVDPASVTNRPKPEPGELVWVEDALPIKGDPSVDGPEQHRWVTKADGQVFSGEKALLRKGKGLNQIYFTQSESPLTIGAGDKFFASVYLDPNDPPKAIMLQYHSDGWKHRANWGDEEAIPYGRKGTSEKKLMGALPKAGEWVRLEIPAADLGMTPGIRVTGMAFTQFGGAVYWDKVGLITVNDPAQNTEISLEAWAKAEKARGDKSDVPEHLKKILKKDLAKLDDKDAANLKRYFLDRIYADPASGIMPLRSEIKTLANTRNELEKQLTATLISKELDKPRPAYVLIRGEYDKHGEKVGPGVPSILPPLPASEATNRLTFAQWLVDPSHPLTARVTVNRFWQQFFGTGLVKTAEDFGSKGEWPSHPELLDWLGTEFIRTGWNVKNLVRLMVTSATYRQDSKVSPELWNRDPENRWLARGPKFRMDAEMLRDNALFVGGLLNLQMGGRGVRTYQPAGIWEAVGYTTSNTAKYSQDTGDALYRRSLYLFWKRTAPPPMMTTFDAPSREQCRPRRERTNTPLQALVTMNDVQYFEAARHLGYRMLKEGGAADTDRLKHGFRLVAARTPTLEEQAVVAEVLTAQRARYANDVEAAKKMIAVGDSKAPEDVPAPELAAYTMVANLLLNLDEVVTRN